MPVRTRSQTKAASEAVTTVDTTESDVEAEESVRKALGEAEQRVLLEFSRLARFVRGEINVTYERICQLEESDDPPDTAAKIEQSIQTIVEHCRPNADPKIHLNALDTLRSIGVAICRSSTDIVGIQVRRHFRQVRTLENGMMNIVTVMREEEIEKLLSDTAPQSLLRMLHHLQRTAQGCCLFDGLEEVIGYIRGDSQDTEDDEDEN
ncbi:hypothetical protein N7468_005721 [Penicillium chermesinum]|uniref:Uncharacterized protein n=1 Tax=Penicillium chermesinum TaxID=63820 RepID=A0A9W9TN89_9EURO|nr:uncharacterized protein N7468_005721 [Penicillium chermesinum]KAJ5232765.1 hypothetical protein N7468_005721 [Penicillium chermesinum]